jgi:hypothetical protein
LCYMPHPSHPSWLDHSNYTWRRVQTVTTDETDCKSKGRIVYKNIQTIERTMS